MTTETFHKISFLFHIQGEQVMLQLVFLGVETLLTDLICIQVWITGQIYLVAGFSWTPINTQ